MGSWRWCALSRSGFRITARWWAACAAQASLGLEPTYYWDALDGSAWDWLHQHTAHDQKIAFGAGPRHSLAWLARWGILNRGYRSEDFGDYRWYVIQQRPSAWQDWDYWLQAHAKPAYRRTLHGVPLLDVYDYRDYLAAKEACEER